MNKVLKGAGIFILGVGLLTGCSEKVAKREVTQNAIKQLEAKEEVSTTNQLNIEDKIRQINKGEKVDSKKDSPTKTNVNITRKNSVERTLPKQEKAIKNISSQHDVAQAGKILEPMTYGMLNLNGSSAANVVRYCASHDGSDNILKHISETYVLDLLNTYNANTYNHSALLQLLQKDQSIEFVQLNQGVKEFTQADLEKLISKKNKVVYLAKDKMFLVKSDIGYGGATDSIFMPVDKWKIDGDKVIVPYETIATRKPTGVMTLRLNNKNYESGKNKTMYYIEKFEIY